jgi:hypothetical protein
MCAAFFSWPLSTTDPVLGFAHLCRAAAEAYLKAMTNLPRCYICGQPLKDADDKVQMLASQIGGGPKVLKAHKACAENKK